MIFKAILLVRLLFDLNRFKNSPFVAADDALKGEDEAKSLLRSVIGRMLRTQA